MRDGYPARIKPIRLESERHLAQPGEEGSSIEAVSHEERKPRSRGAAWEIVETIILAVFIFVAVRTVILNFRVDGESMEPTLDSGQMLLVNRQVYAHFDANELLDWLPFIEMDGERVVYPFHPPQRGDIVVLRPPVDQGTPYIKRIVGLPGERIAIHDGTIYVNGEPLEEEYLPGMATSWPGAIGQNAITIPDGYVFVMGDNRNNSSDSRVFGPVPKSSIIGKAWVAYWPLGEAKIISHPDYPIDR